MLGEVLIGLANIIVVGDFNCPHLLELKDAKSCAVKNFMDFVGLDQKNQINNESGHILDLILTQDVSCTVKRDTNPILPEDTYHPSLNLSIKLDMERDKCIMYEPKNYNFRKADFVGLYTYIQEIDWSPVALATSWMINVINFITSFTIA